jgi:3-phosphoshikimate 1-carboxyvinyltransferase
MSPVYRVPAMRLPSDCELLVPGSKSHANRAIVCACLSDSTTTIKNSTPCDDVLAMVDCLKRLGFDLRWINEQHGELSVKGGVPRSGGTAVLDAHNAGTTLRFLTSVASLIAGEWTVTGDEHMRKRPIGDLTKALRALGAVIEDKGGCPPLKIHGGTLKGRAVRLKADISSQYLTSLLLISPLLKEGLSVELVGALASSGYIDLTEKTMKDFGIQITRKENTFSVQHGKYVSPASYEIEGDWSAAGSWFVLQALTGSSIAMPNLRNDSMQSDRKLPDAIRKLKKTGDVTLDCSQIPDQVMNLCVLAAFRKGTATFTKIANLRKKECDRLHVIATELKKAGVDIRELDDDLVIRGAGSIEKVAKAAGPVTLDPHDDHRMVMAFAIFGLLRGNIAIRNPDCVWKSYPTFFMDLETVVRSGRTVTIIGMRGVGKSALGRKLAATLRMKHIDSDHLFEKQHGSIRTFIEKKGWPEFRKKEEEVIASAIQNGTILSLGGGALSEAKTRALIKKRTIPVWLQAKETELVKRLQSGKRPPLTDLPLHQEVRKFLLERGPHYREVAAIEISPKLRYGEQIPFVLRSLAELLRSHDFHSS